MRNLFCTLIFLFISLLAYNQNKKLAIIGSSTAAGSGASPLDSSWVRRINYHYKYIQGILDTTYNRAKPGLNSYHGMPTSYIPPAGRPYPMPDSNITRAISFNPNVIIVSYVSNQFDVYTVPEIMYTLQTIKDSANLAGKVCFICTTQPRTEFNDAGRLKLRVLKDSIINRFGYFAINFWNPIADSSNNTIAPQYRYAFDNIHINNAGHRVLYEEVLAKDIFNAALPVRITQFGGIIKNDQVLLDWSAYNNEIDAGFTVQRSKDGIQFESLQFVLAINSATRTNYQFVDKSPFAGLSFYRLEINQASGKFFSKTISIKKAGSFNIRRIYPVPANRFLHIEFSVSQAASFNLTIVNINGVTVRSIKKVLNRSQSILPIPVFDLPAGQYFIKIQSQAGETIMSPFTKK